MLNFPWALFIYFCMRWCFAAFMVWKSPDTDPFIIRIVDLIWWILGALTLMPILLGSKPQWTASAAAEAFPVLIGHLGYGASLGVVFLLARGARSALVAVTKPIGSRTYR